MSKANRNVVLFAKIQPTTGVDSVPVAATNSILCSAPVVNPLNAQAVERNNVQPYFGNQGKIITEIYSTVEFEVELQSSGVAGTAPKFAPLLRACAMAETIVASTSAAYNPITTGIEMVSMYYFLDGIKHVLLDAKGTVSFALNAKGIPVMKYKFWGFYSTPTDVTMPTGVDYSGFLAPLPITKANTPTLTLQGFAAKVSSLTLDLANQVEYRNVIGSEEIKIVDRKPVGQILMESPDTVAAKDWYSVVKNGTLGAIAVTHGTVAGRIVTFAGPTLQVSSLDYQEEQGIAMISANLDIQPSTGNDELIVTFR